MQTLTTDDLAGAMSAREAGAKVGKGHVTVMNWIHRGVKVRGEVVKLAALRIGAHYAILPAALDAFLTACNPATAQVPESPTRRGQRFKREQRELAARLRGEA